MSPIPLSLERYERLIRLLAIDVRSHPAQQVLRLERLERRISLLEIDLMLCRSVDARKEPETPERLARCAANRTAQLERAKDAGLLCPDRPYRD